MSAFLRNSLIWTAILIPIAARAAENPPQLETSWGSFGSDAGQLWNPAGMAIIPGCQCLLVAEIQNHRIQKFSYAGVSQGLWGGPNPSTADGGFARPSGVVIDGSGNVYVADTSNDRIQKFTAAGAFLQKWGTEGTGSGELDEPVAIALSPNGDLYVVELENHRVQRFTTSGASVDIWGSSGTGNGQFRFPGGIAVDHWGCVYVSDSANNRIQKFEADGTFVGVVVTGALVNNPHHLAVDGAGNVYIADWGNNRVVKVNTTGELLTNWGSYGQDDGEFVGPTGVTVDAEGSVFVADGYNRIQKFSTMVAVEPTTWGRLKALFPGADPGR